MLSASQLLTCIPTVHLTPNLLREQHSLAQSNQLQARENSRSPRHIYSSLLSTVANTQPRLTSMLSMRPSSVTMKRLRRTTQRRNHLWCQSISLLTWVWKSFRSYKALKFLRSFSRSVEGITYMEVDTTLIHMTESSIWRWIHLAAADAPSSQSTRTGSRRVWYLNPETSKTVARVGPSLQLLP